ncbi:MAG: glycoside hydrolase family 3 protein [Anaerolineae bacterium]|nr:glycoside hydrolase family 3 protein [Anaerolineae bacterium]
MSPSIRRLTFPVVLCWIVVILSGSFAPPTGRAWGRSPDLPGSESVTLGDLSLEEKVGQLFLLTLFSTTLDQSDRDLIAATHPGGVVLFPHNLGSPQAITRLTNAIQSHAMDVGPDVPLLIAVDQEGGRVLRLQDGFTIFPSVLMVGAAGSQHQAVQFGYAMGQEMAAVGINMNLAPVTDLAYPDASGGIGQVLYRRAIASDPGLVGRLAGGMVNGMRQAGVIGVLKHFPGHGAAELDSHSVLAEVRLSREEVNRTALAAFAGAINAGAPAVMVGHLYYPALDPGVRRPATVSPVVLDVLRRDLGFGGVVVSDAMDMGAIKQDYDMADAVIEAINAGVDLIAFGPHVLPWKQQQVIAAVVDAARSGRIPAARLDEAVGRMLSLRDSYGLMTWTPLDVGQTAERLNRTGHNAVLNVLAQEAVTILDNQAGLLPLDGANRRVVILYPADYDDIPDTCWPFDGDLTALGYTYNPTGWDIANATALAAKADVIVVFIEDLWNNSQQHALVWALPPEKTIVVSLRSPFDWYDLPVPLTTVVLTYDNIPEARGAVCRVLYGEVPARGRLPMAVGPYPPGGGVTWDTVVTGQPSN